MSKILDRVVFGLAGTPKNDKTRGADLQQTGKHWVREEDGLLLTVPLCAEISRQHTHSLCALVIGQQTYVCLFGRKVNLMGYFSDSKEANRATKEAGLKPAGMHLHVLGQSGQHK